MYMVLLFFFPSSQLQKGNPLNSTVSYIYFGICFVLFNSTCRMVHRILQIQLKNKSVAIASFFPSPTFFFILLLLLGQNKTRNREWHNKICYYLCCNSMDKLQPDKQHSWGFSCLARSTDNSAFPRLFCMLNSPITARIYGSLISW